MRGNDVSVPMLAKIAMIKEKRQYSAEMDSNRNTETVRVFQAILFTFPLSLTLAEQST